MPNRSPKWVGWSALLLALGMTGFALAQNEGTAPTATPAPTSSPPDRDYRPSEEVSADTEVDFPADL